MCPSNIPNIHKERESLFRELFRLPANKLVDRVYGGIEGSRGADRLFRRPKDHRGYTRDLTRCLNEGAMLNVGGAYDSAW